LRAVQLDGEPRRRRSSVDGRDRIGRDRSSVVRAEERSQRLTQLDRTAVVARRELERPTELVVDQPRRQLRRRAEPLPPVLEVDGVDERLDEPKWLRRGLGDVIPRADDTSVP
jgi:hypothetical protein